MSTATADRATAARASTAAQKREFSGQDDSKSEQSAPERRAESAGRALKEEGPARVPAGTFCSPQRRHL
jgi:hypothetical protein